MDKTKLKETLQHGTPAFPVAIYNNIFDKHQQLLAYLHYHNEFELLLATRGTLCIQLEENSYVLSPGEGIFINSGCLHTINAQDEGEHGFIAVVFDYSLLCQEHEAVFAGYVQPLLMGRRKALVKLTPEFGDLIRDICIIYEEGAFGYELRIKQSLLHIFYLLMKAGEDTMPGVQNSKSLLVKEVLDYIRVNYGEPISLSLLAEQVHVSREYLCRTFRALSGSTPIEFLNRYRIRQSTFLLSQTDKSISEIAQNCGFNHSSYYGKLFFEYMGCTPGEYRKHKG
ncbi:MAG: helix-turn-helix transcriptional regulator [Lachnospiraceae bacterium]|nr:helix-turn-helix transcriptional regulator [Lachnospiraceae bacterium]